MAICPTNEAFKEWASDLIIYDLEYWLQRFEEEERYEQCVILRDLVNEFNKSAKIIELYKGYL